MPRRIVAPASLTRLAEEQEGLVSARQCHEHGLTDQQAAALVRRQVWVRVARGVYDTRRPGTSSLDRYDRARRRRAVLGVLAHPGSVATGVSALVLHGVQGAPVDIAPEVTFPDGSPRSGTSPVRVRRLPLRRWNMIDGLPCATAEDALAQAVPELERRYAVALMDSARRRRAVSEPGFRRARDQTRGRNGARRSASWWDESDRRSESPAETWARLSLTDAGCPPDTLQLVVRNPWGGFLARVDLAWFLPDGGVLLVEIDGREVHSRLDAVLADRHRQNLIAGRGSTLLRFSGSEAFRGAVAGDVRQVLDAAGWVPRRTTDDRPFVLST